MEQSMSVSTNFSFDKVTILKDQILGHGSYGAVYMAKCDQLMCAAKVLHPTIVNPYNPGSGKILQRFRQECDFLNRIRHPNIVQCLGVCQDLESNLSVLLMELLDCSLTEMLDESTEPIPYHIQVDLCTDVSLAISYLHSYGIVHCDLSGNNVLVQFSERKAKVTDFGMSKLARSIHDHISPLILCPGTPGYMSPESLKEPPQYTEKLDVFSQGIIIIQVCTRQFPDPGPAVKEKEDLDSPTGAVQVPVLEPERRKNHIDLIDPNHPLLPIAITCLEYRESNRPSAEELFKRLAALKKEEAYIHCLQVEINETQWQKLARKHQEVKFPMLAPKDIVEQQQDETDLQELRLKKLSIFSETQVDDQTEHQVSLVESQEMCGEDCSEQKSKLIPGPATESIEDDFKWRDAGMVPFKELHKRLRQGSVVDGKMVYFLQYENVYSFNSVTKEWNTDLPPCPHEWSSLVIVQGLLTIVGGWVPSESDLLFVSTWETTNKLLTLTKTDKAGEWIEKLPPMPTSRQGATSTRYKNHLIVAGGSTTLYNDDNLNTVEILNTDTLIWYTMASIKLPHPIANGSATVCSDRLYILGGNDKLGRCQSVFSCILEELLQSCQKHTTLGHRRLVKEPPHLPSVWQCITDTPMYYSTCATVSGQVLAFGGCDDSNQKTSSIYKYDPNAQSWNHISYMNTPRSACYVAVMESGEILVVSGTEKMTDSEIASIP